MKTLIKKELSLLLCSPVAIFFVVVFLLVTGLINWFFPGKYNIMDAGYATLKSFFELLPLLFIILIPALTMRSFSEEIRNKNLDIFRTRPKHLLSLYLSKMFSIWALISIVLLSSGVYVYILYMLSNPIGNIDFNEITASYISMFAFSLVFISIGLFTSSLTKNQIVAYILALILNFLFFYGFELLASLFSNSETKLFVSSLGLWGNSSSLMKGVLSVSAIVLIFNYTFLFSIVSVFVLSLKNKRTKKLFTLSISTFFLINVLLFFIPNHRFDFTSDKRYTLSDYTKELLSDISTKESSYLIKVYLDGELNPGFLRLKNASEDLLSDYTRSAGGRIAYEFINPLELSVTPQEVYKKMEDAGMRGILLNETDHTGKSSRRMIYPFAQVISGSDTLLVNMLKNIPGYSAEENLNASAENLEFEFTDAIRLMSKPEADAIAFIEGHGEISRPYVYDAEELLSKYFFVNRGQIGNNISDLDAFKAIIIAGPVQRFTEKDKFIIDQYIMSGGKVLWLVDGVYFSDEELSKNGQSASMKNDANLDDLLFTYGVRINPVLLQDTQCASIYIASGDDENDSQYFEQPWYYTPLLLPSIDHPVTKDITLVKTAFASSLDIIGKSNEVEKKVLLTTSPHTHVVNVPEMIELDLSGVQVNQQYFNQSFLPVAISLQGSFSSAFVNRAIPDSVVMGGKRFMEKSAIPSKMIVVSSSEIIRNDLLGSQQQTQVVPMGYDRVSEKQYGNRDFIVNAVNWLANDDDFLSLRSKQQTIRLLNRPFVYANRNLYAFMATAIPILISVLLIGVFYFYRKRKYS